MPAVTDDLALMESACIGAEEFATLMVPFGVFPPDDPRYPVAIAVSGGADSLCLAVLMRQWRKAVLALIVDHGLRSDSAEEAARTARTLERCDIPSVILPLHGLDPCRAVQEQARNARFAVLARACRERGILDLALAHHARDQAETFLLRKAHGSGAQGLAGMALCRESAALRFLRPLLPVDPCRLRQTLAGMGIDWIEDPSNGNRAFERVRIRQDMTHEIQKSAITDAVINGIDRSEKEKNIADDAVYLRFDPLGFVVLSRMPDDPALLGRLWKMVAGQPYAPSPDRMAALCLHPEPVSLAGALLVRAGRLGPGWMLVREPGAIRHEAVLNRGIIWDNRWQMQRCEALSGLTVARLGSEARHFRQHQLPACVLAGLPALWRGGHVIGVPPLDEGCPDETGGTTARWVSSFMLTDGSFWHEVKESMKT